MKRPLRAILTRIHAWRTTLWARRYDGLALAGAGAIAWGAGLVFRPAGVMLAGVVLLAWAAIGSWTERRERRRS